MSRNDGWISANGCAAKFALQALIIVLHANREHRRDAYATLGSATCLTPWPPTVLVVRHSTKLLGLSLSLVDFLDSSSPIALATLRVAP